MRGRKSEVIRSAVTFGILVVLVSSAWPRWVTAESGHVWLPTNILESTTLSGQTAYSASSQATDAFSREVAALPTSPRVQEAPTPQAEATAVIAPLQESRDISEISYDSPVDYFPRDAVRKEVKGLMWTKGDFKIVPYGILWTDMIYSTSRAFPGRFILWIDSDELQGEDTFQIESRYSRVGVNIEGPKSCLFGGITSGGKVEIDFLGNFLTENQPDLRLRHAYWEAKNDRMRILVGQTWDLISPRYPNTVNFSVAWGAGNIGFRRAQMRLERYYHLSDRLTWSLQGALAQNVIQDFATTVGIRRETGNWPMVQARTAFRYDDGCRPACEIGFSGHVSETGFDFATGHPANPALGPEDDARFDSWSFNVDFQLPVTQRLGFQGEFFTGANLSNELGGIVQGVCPCLRVPIRSTGGWCEIEYVLSSRVRTHAGFGIDDPRNNDMVVGRSYNRTVYGNVFVDLTKHVTTAFGVSSWRTNYQNRSNEPGFDPVPGPTTPGEAIVLDWSMRFAF